MWRQMPPVESLTFSSQMSQNSLPSNLVSILHPSSASLLQSLYNQPISGSHLTNSFINENYVSHEKLRSNFLENRLESPARSKQDLLPVFNYQMVASQGKQQRYPYSDKKLFLNSNLPNPLEESLRKASTLNHWIQKQWNAIETRSQPQINYNKH